MRKSEISRTTKETDITVRLNLDDSSAGTIDSGIGFFDHMLNLFSKHGRLHLDLCCQGDLKVDGHHSVEDMGIVLGGAIKAALGDKMGITRYATAFTPMDEALSRVVVDLGGRGFLAYDLPVPTEKIGELETETLPEFFRALAMNAGLNLHIHLEYGDNAHHMVESVFKGLGRALYEASRIDESIDGLLSTKGSL